VEYKPETPFDNIESAHEYLGLLAQALDEARQNVESDIADEVNAKSPRRLDAFRLVLYKLDKLGGHVKNGRRLLNDLRTLRRLLLEARVEAAVAKPGPESKSA